MKKSSKMSAGLNPQFIIDAQGKKTSVILDIRTYERLVEYIEGLYLGFIAAERSEKPSKHEAAYPEADDREVESLQQEI